MNAQYGVLLVSGSHTHQEGYAAAFAVCALFPLIAIQLVPVSADPLINTRG